MFRSKVWWLGSLPLIFFLAVTVWARWAPRPRSLGLTRGALSGCPGSPNCVCSQDEQAPHAIEPFSVVRDAASSWQRLCDIVASAPRTRVITRTPDYLHAEAQSWLLGFVDDLEFHLRPDGSAIDCRSASRRGRSDFGVNRRRIEALRRQYLAGA